MVKTAGQSAVASGILERRFRHRDRLRGADIEPQALVDGAERAAVLDRAVPQEVRRKWAVRRVAQQPLRNHLDASEDERGDTASFAPTNAPGAVHMEVAHSAMIERSRLRDEQQ